MVPGQSKMAFLQKNGFSMAIFANKHEVNGGAVWPISCRCDVKKVRVGVIL